MFRDETRSALADYCRAIDVESLIARYGTPLLLIDPARVAEQYDAIARELPFARIHYAVKALSHPAVLETVAARGGSFDIATSGELELLRRSAIPFERAIHTHPITTPLDIFDAYTAGIRLFEVDNRAEIDKYVRMPRDTRVLVRLSFPNPGAVSDLSSKFGAPPDAAADLVRYAVFTGVTVAGFTFHVGSQSDAAEPFRHAITRTLDLMASLGASLGCRFDTIDIGGGFPVGYHEAAQPLGDICAVIRELLEPHLDRLTVLAEPGRIIAAPSGTLVTSVVGTSDRADGRWHYLDDGVYGSYSNVLAEGVRPQLFAVDELLHGAVPDRDVTFAGSSCDSVDVVARRHPAPDLAIGDTLVSPMMGAYTAVTATTFNGIPLTRTMVLDAADRDLSPSAPNFAEMYIQ